MPSPPFWIILPFFFFSLTNPQLPFPIMLLHFLSSFFFFPQLPHAVATPIFLFPSKHPYFDFFLLLFLFLFIYYYYYFLLSFHHTQSFTTIGKTTSQSPSASHLPVDDPFLSFLISSLSHHTHFLLLSLLLLLFCYYYYYCYCYCCYFILFYFNSNYCLWNLDCWINIKFGG